MPTEQDLGLAANVLLARAAIMRLEANDLKRTSGVGKRRSASLLKWAGTIETVAAWLVQQKGD